MPWPVMVRPRKHANLGYTAREIAAAFGLSIGTVYNMSRDGRLPTIHLGGVLRFPKAAVRAMLKHGHNLKV